MNALETWLVIIGLTAVTIATRSFFLVLGDRIPLPERVQHALRFAPACALAALIAPEVLTVQGQLALSAANLKLLAGAVAIVTMLTTRSMIATMVIGMGVFTGLRLFG
jgi:branched-subunit amino acid transport protein